MEVGNETAKVRKKSDTDARKEEKNEAALEWTAMQKGFVWIEEICGSREDGTPADGNKALEDTGQLRADPYLKEI